MNNNNNNNNLNEYLSLILVISFFIIHNIYLVFIGMIISIVIGNRRMIDSLLIYIKKINRFIKPNLGLKVNKKLKKLSATEEKSSFELVYRIEELGFIPSKNND